MSEQSNTTVLEEIILEGHQVTKCFRGLRAVSNVDIVLHKHEILGLIGPNGAGKTTLFNMLSGTDRKSVV